jgi:glycosyltransferase involved in cell wall biosynthesis
MFLAVTLDFRFTQTPDGRVWTRTTYTRPFWERYLNVFDKVKVIARAEQVAEVGPEYKLVTGPGVEFDAVPYYLGPWQYLKIRGAVRRQVRSSLAPQDAVLCRVGSRLADDLIPILWRQRRPYGLEVVGDPMESLAPGAVKHPLRPVFRQMSTHALKMQCARASAVSYVTEHALQRRYPAGHDRLSISVSDAELQPNSFTSAPRVFTTYYSSTDLAPEAYAPRPKLHTGPVPPRITFVGSLAQMYKGPDILLQALSLLSRQGLPIELSLVGGGRHLPELKDMAKSLEISHQVTFHGELPAGPAIREQLDWASLFVLPSRTEGLPRVLLEAMARALPCVASNVGGIPELLHADDLVAPSNPEALAARVRQVLHSPERMNAMSVRNLQKVQEFRPDLLERRRTEFYRFLKEVTQNWVSARHSSAA